jgi:hypothetical protein
MTDRELRDAIEQAPPDTDRWKALIRAAYLRPSFPLSWLPSGVTGTRTGDYGSNDGHGSGE